MLLEDNLPGRASVQREMEYLPKCYVTTETTVDSPHRLTSIARHVYIKSTTSYLLRRKTDQCFHATSSSKAFSNDIDLGFTLPSRPRTRHLETRFCQQSRPTLPQPICSIATCPTTTKPFIQVAESTQHDRQYLPISVRAMAADATAEDALR
jgi:hypothetical protein